MFVYVCGYEYIDTVCVCVCLAVSALALYGVCVSVFGFQCTDTVCVCVFGYPCTLTDTVRDKRTPSIGCRVY